MSERISRDLSRRAAEVAVRVADLLENLCSEEAGGESVAFLRDWAASAAQRAAATPVAHPPADTPLDRLVHRFGLGSLETELVLFAGLPEEHEGLARTFRTMHPGGAPHPSVGLAGLLTDCAARAAARGGVRAQAPDRVALRRLLHEGPAVRAGVLALTGEGPFHERSLTLADGLWEALHGHRARPAVLEEADPGPPVAGLDGWLELPETARAVAALRSRDPRILLVGARDETVGLSRCAALARAAGLGLFAARTRPEDPRAMGLLGLHAAVRDAVPLLVVAAPEGGAAGPVTPAVARIPGPLLVCAAPGTVRPGPHRPVLTVPVGPIGTADRRTAWRAALPEAPEQAPRLAARHPLDPALTAQVALDVHSRAALAPGDVRDDAGPGGARAQRGPARGRLPPRG
ncbi:hypothetical protein ABT331_31845, partial [Streptomyces sp. NPDC000659]